MTTDTSEMSQAERRALMPCCTEILKEMFPAVEAEFGVLAFTAVEKSNGAHYYWKRPESAIEIARRNVRE